MNTLHTQLQQLFAARGLTDALYVADIVQQLTSLRTGNIAELTDAEAALIRSGLESGSIDLQAEYAHIQRLKADKCAQVITIASRTGFFPIAETNFDFFDAWMKKSSPAKKSIWFYSNIELDTLLATFANIEKLFNEKAKEVGSPAWKIKQARAQLTRND